MKFDAQRAYQHIAQLAFPRAVGSEGEAKARAYIVEQLSAVGLRVEEESFDFTQFPAEVLPRLIFAGVTVAVLIACSGATSHPILMSLLCDSVLVGVFVFTRWQTRLERLYNTGKKHTSKNIIASCDASDDVSFEIVFVAHYDSKSQLLPIAVRALCYSIALMLLLGLAMLTMLQYYLRAELLGVLIWTVGGGICFCLMLLQFNFTQNRSPGAFDNASGVGVLLELARCLTVQTPTGGIRLTFLSTGAEEYGMCGALRYIQQHADQHNPKRTFVVNIDGVGAIGEIVLITRYGIPPVVTSRRLGRAIRECGAEIGIDASEIYFPVGVGYDGIPIASRGFETVTLSAGGFGGASLKIHSKNDGMELIDPGSLQRVGDLIVHFVMQCVMRP